MYYVLENDNSNDDSTGTKVKSEVAQVSEDSSASEDVPPLLECNPADGNVKDDSITEISVSGDATERLGSDSSNYAEVGATSADKD